MTFRDLLTLLTGVTVCCGQLHVIGREETGGPVELSFPPVRVVLVQDVDHLTFGEAHLVPVGGFIVIYGYHLTDCVRGEDSVSGGRHFYLLTRLHYRDPISACRHACVPVTWLWCWCGLAAA